jgi:hypothetical protein
MRTSPILTSVKQAWRIVILSSVVLVGATGSSPRDLLGTRDTECTARKDSLLSDLSWFEAIYDFEHDYGATKEPGAFPRLLNFFNIHGCIIDTAYQGHDLVEEMTFALSRWDDVCLSIYNVDGSQIPDHVAIHRQIKAKNPSVRLFLYFPGGQHPRTSSGLIANTIIDTLDAHDWWVHAPDGSYFPPEPRWTMIQLTNDSAAVFVADVLGEVFSTLDPADTLYAGVWLDLIRGEYVLRRWFTEYGWQIDLDRDGVDDVQEIGVEAVIDSIQSGYARLLAHTRENIGADRIIVGNPGWPWMATEENDDLELFALANGNMKEGPEGVNAVVSGGVRGAADNAEHAYGDPERYFAINLQYTDPAQYGRPRMVRYALTMTCMTDAYFFCDAHYGFRWHNCIWWWPIYNVDLGFAATDSMVLADTLGRRYYRRDFDNGIVVANHSDDSVFVALEGDFYDVSSGEMTGSFVLPPRDGRILLYQDPSTTPEVGALPRAALEVHPNPARARLALRVRGVTPVGVRLLDVRGRAVLQARPVSGSREAIWIDVAGLAAGTYFVEVETATGERTVGRVLILR